MRSRIEGRTEQLDGRGHESVFHGSFIHYLPSISADILRATPGMGERNSIYAVPLQGSPCGCPQTCSTMLCESLGHWMEEKWPTEHNALSMLFRRRLLNESVK